MGFESISEELKAKIKACKTQEELEALAAEEHFELTDDVLDELAAAGVFEPIPICQTKCKALSVPGCISLRYVPDYTAQQ